MTSLPVSGYFVNPARTNGEAKAAWDDMTDFDREDIGGAPITEVTIDSGGTIAPTTGLHRVDTFADAATDNLDNIGQATLVDGRLLILRAENDGRTVVVRHAQGGTGQIVLSDAQSFSMDDTKKWLFLHRNGLNWEEIGRFYGNDPAGFASFYDVIPNVFTTRGDLVVQGASTAERIPLGASGQVLGSDGIDAQWVDGNLLGEIRMYAIATPPAKWLVCDGSEINRTTYSALYAVIGDTWGNGNGTTTFNIPDMRGRCVIGTGQGDTAEGGGTGTNRLVATLGGKEEHTQVNSEVGNHGHRYSTAPGDGSFNNSSSNGNFVMRSQFGATRGPFTGDATTNQSLARNQAQASVTAMPNMSPFAVATYMIYAGV